MRIILHYKLIIFFCLFSSSVCSVQLVRDFIQFNVAGHPVLHKDLEFHFDPDIGARRARQYEALNGKYGEKAIERLGLGIDGYDQERLAKQRIRDEGNLQGATEYS